MNSYQLLGNVHELSTELQLEHSGSVGIFFYFDSFLGEGVK